MPPVRRTTAAAPPAPPQETVNFGSLDMYAAGGGLPEGDYALEFSVQMFQATRQTGQTAGPPRLGVVITAHSLTDPAAEPRTQFYSMGSNADKSFGPDPETGKSLVKVAGSVGGTLNNSTNWALLLKSLYDCGLPAGIFTNDVSVLDGIWAHMVPVPEPEERKGFGGSKTGEVAEERKAGTIAIISEIKEDGKPWEGGGGFDYTAAPAVQAPPAKRPGPAGRVGAPAPAAAPARPTIAARRPAAPAPPVTEEAGGDDDIMTAAINGISTVLEKSPNGVTKLMMRTGTFKAVNEAAGAEVAQAVIETFFGSDDALNGLLGQIGYGVQGQQIKQQV